MRLSSGWKNFILAFGYLTGGPNVFGVGWLNGFLVEYFFWAHMERCRTALSAYWTFSLSLVSDGRLTRIFELGAFNSNLFDDLAYNTQEPASQWSYIVNDNLAHDSQEPSSRAAAEATLLAFRKSSQPVPACQYILGVESCPNRKLSFHYWISIAVKCSSRVSCIEWSMISFIWHMLLR